MTTGRARSSLQVFRAARAVTVLGLLVATGCVERRFIIESNVPNSQVYIDNQSVGAAPSYSSFEYYGYHNVTIVRPGYETLTERVHVVAPWYAYPPFDFVVEALWPFHIRDKRRYYFELHEITKPRVDDLIQNAEALRERGANLPVPEHPAPPKTPSTQPAPVVPPLGPQSGTFVPPVGPQTSPGAPSVGPAPSSVVPSVLPPTQ
jgi:hypothetical protein